MHTSFRSIAGAKLAAMLAIRPVVCLFPVENLQQSVLPDIAQQVLILNSAGVAVECPEAGDHIAVWQDSYRMPHTAAHIRVLLVSGHQIMEIHCRLVTDSGIRRDFLHHMNVLLALSVVQCRLRECRSPA